MDSRDFIREIIEFEKYNRDLLGDLGVERGDTEGLIAVFNSYETNTKLDKIHTEIIKLNEGISNPEQGSPLSYIRRIFNNQGS